MKIKYLIFVSLFFISVEAITTRLVNPTSIVCPRNEERISIIKVQLPVNAIVTDVRAELRAFNVISPSDVQVALLAPDLLTSLLSVGISSRNLVLMNNSGQTNPAGKNIFLSDESTRSLPASNQEYPVQEDFRPTSYGQASHFIGYNLPQPTGTSTFRSTLTGSNLNGDWQLIVFYEQTDNSLQLDDAIFAEGWVLELTYEVPGCSVSGRQSNLFSAIRNKFGR